MRTLLLCCFTLWTALWEPCPLFAEGEIPALHLGCAQGDPGLWISIISCRSMAEDQSRSTSLMEGWAVWYFSPRINGEQNLLLPACLCYQEQSQIRGKKGHFCSCFMSNLSSLALWSHMVITHCHMLSPLIGLGQPHTQQMSGEGRKRARL